jgi:hypothetical protein
MLIHVSIIFIHGLQGNPINTWSYQSKKPGRFKSISQKMKRTEVSDVKYSTNTEEGATVYWPKQFLARDIPNARIMTFGYITKVKGTEAINQGTIFSHSRNLMKILKAKRIDEPNRALIFIAHSLGGILVKECLRRAQEDPDELMKSIYFSTVGIIFFGTPHRGSPDWASFGEGVSKVASAIIGMDMNSAIIHALLPSGTEHELVRESFARQWVERGQSSNLPSLTVRTYQEGTGPTVVKWGGFNKKVIAFYCSMPSYVIPLLSDTSLS